MLATASCVGECNDDGVCNDNESCDCADCNGQQDACSSALECSIESKTCVDPMCGDETVDAGEECDDGDDGSATCGARGTPHECKTLCPSGEVKCLNGTCMGSIQECGVCQSGDPTCAQACD